MATTKKKNRKKPATKKRPVKKPARKRSRNSAPKRNTAPQKPAAKRNTASAKKPNKSRKRRNEEKPSAVGTLIDKFVPLGAVVEVFDGIVNDLKTVAANPEGRRRIDLKPILARNIRSGKGTASNPFKHGIFRNRGRRR